MRSNPTSWTCAPYSVGAALRLSEELDVSATVAAVLVRRGLDEPRDARSFLAAADSHDPGLLPGASAASKLILEHLQRGSLIAVHGDYDVDGVCSTAILLRTLRALGADPRWELPSRFGEGYGLSGAAVERQAARGVGLLVTVDCGITAVEEVAAARAAGIDVLVTDHHRPGERLPDCPVVHPALGDYPCPDLCAAGVALKLSEALLLSAGRDPRGAEEDLDLAALATICDLVPLRGENRRIARAGIEALRRTRKPGLRALMAVADLDPGDADEQCVGFRLGPRLNAAGRMQRADAALELLMTEDEQRAREVAQELDLLNRDRREAETRILFAADAACADQAAHGALVVAGEGWHPGVVGIVASRLVERWRRPCVVIALDGQSARGSGRSIKPYDLHAGLSACAAHLRRFGGHRVAAGVELDADKVEPFRRSLAAHAGAQLSPHDLIAHERIDAVVPGGALGLALAEELQALRPFGMGNPQPTLLVPAARVEGVAGMGEERQHARFTLVTGSSRSRGVAFGSTPRSLAAAGGEPHDLAVRLEPNRWNGAVEPRVVLRAVCATRPGELRVLGEADPFWTRVERELARGLDSAEVPPVGRPATAGSAGGKAAQLARDAAAADSTGGQAARLAGDAAGAAPRDRRGEGFAGVAGELLTSGEPVLVAVADVPRRRASLEALVGGLAPDGLAVSSWSSLLADPAIAQGFLHLIALDPPPGGRADPVLRRGGALAHLAWGLADVEFSLAVWRSQLALDAPLREAWRALSALPQEQPEAAELEAALRGSGRYGRSPESCAHLLRVLTELDLVEFTPSAGGGPRCRLRHARRTDLERSETYRACRSRLALIERDLAAELPAPRSVAAVAAPV